MSGDAVMVAMSGGVDSSVAALLLAEKRYRVVGVSMDLLPRGIASSCCDIASLRRARKTAGEIGIEHHVVDMRREFRDKVIMDFLREYSRGRTPNPCIRCNERLKFDLLFKLAARLGCGYLATGHYARVTRSRDGVYRLRRSSYREKDQSYALYTLKQAHLKRLLLPLGEMSKPEVRAAARKRGLEVAGRPDSQDVCFVPGGDYPAFMRVALSWKLPAGLRAALKRSFMPGDALSGDGQILGRHRGLACYTVGQRAALGGAGGRYYVRSLNVEKNTITVCGDEGLLDGGLTAIRVNFVSGREPMDGTEVGASIRYGQKPFKARLRRAGRGRWEMSFQRPQRAVTPGQAAVFYRGDEIVGGGVISGPLK